MSTAGNTVERIVIATGNPGKLREMQVMLAGVDVAVVSQAELGVSPGDETGDTFVANALQKARHAARQTGLPVIADDSGLVVAALDGAPGIFSARYAGPGASDEANVDKLLTELDAETDRAAYFHCAAVFLRNADDAFPLIAEGSWHGEISRERKGRGGFGYDPVFFVPELGVNSAELPADEKNRRSHRGLAMRELVAELKTLLSTDRAG